MNNSNHENIELSLPINAAYVSAARLTASSIANRIGFSTNEIEDIKAAVSEACNFVIKKSTLRGGKFKIVFVVGKGSISINLTCASKIEQSASDGDLSLLMIKALMDKTEIKNADFSKEGVFEILMEKTHKVDLF